MKKCIHILQSNINKLKIKLEFFDAMCGLNKPYITHFNQVFRLYIVLFIISSQNWFSID